MEPTRLSRRAIPQGAGHGAATRLDAKRVAIPGRYAQSFSTGDQSELRSSVAGHIGRRARILHRGWTTRGSGGGREEPGGAQILEPPGALRSRDHDTYYSLRDHACANRARPAHDRIARRSLDAIVV